MSDYGGEGMEEEGGYGGRRGYEGGGWSRLKDEITRIERVEHNTTIGHIVTNEDGIKDFKVFIFWLRELSIGYHFRSENDIEKMQVFSDINM